jgi:hypothetical protein
VLIVHHDIIEIAAGDYKNDVLQATDPLSGDPTSKTASGQDRHIGACPLQVCFVTYRGQNAPRMFQLAVRTSRSIARNAVEACGAPDPILASACCRAVPSWSSRRRAASTSLTETRTAIERSATTSPSAVGAAPQVARPVQVRRHDRRDGAEIPARKAAPGSPVVRHVGQESANETPIKAQLVGQTICRKNLAFGWLFRHRLMITCCGHAAFR